MFRTVAMTLLAVGVQASVGAALAADAAAADSAAAVKSDASRQAAQRAVQKLAAQLQIPETEIAVTNTEPRTWTDSSLGCGKPGTVALTVITEGHAITLTARGEPYRVHVSNSNAVICKPAKFMRKELRRPSHGRGLEAITAMARDDLARRLGVAASEVRVVRSQPKEFADSGLGCPRQGETLLAGPVPGFRMTLQHAQRTYMYHTDLSQVRPCPALESK